MRRLDLWPANRMRRLDLWPGALELACSRCRTYALVGFSSVWVTFGWLFLGVGENPS